MPHHYDYMSDGTSRGTDGRTDIRQMLYAYR